MEKKDLDGIPFWPKNFQDGPGKPPKAEPDGAGRHMMQHVLAGAEGLKKAKSVQEAQKAFASTSDALLPFFKSWPNQLKRNELKMCRCKIDGHCWLQPQNGASVCPYAADQATLCSDIEEVKQ